MTRPITAPPPVNATISVQPVGTPNAQSESTSIPAALANLAPGTTVSGFVVNRDALSNPILRTALGDVLVQSDVFLRTGSEVVFRIDPTLATRARIVTVDGLTPQDYSAQNTRGLQQDTITPSLLQPRATVANAATIAARAEGNVPQLQAVVLQAAPVSATQIPPGVNPASLPPRFFAEAIPPALVRLAAGTPIQLTVLDIRLPPVPVSLAALPDVDLPPQLLSPAPASTAPASPTPAAAPTTTSVTNAIPTPTAAPTASAAPPTTPATPVPSAPVNAASATIVPNSNPIPENARPTALPANPAPPAVNSTALGSVATATPAASTQASPTTSAATVAVPANSGAVPVAAATNTTPPLPQTPAAFSIPPTPVTPRSPILDATNPAAPLLSATVIGHEADGATILQTRFATLKLYTPQPLPTGSTLTVQAEIAPETAALIPSNVVGDELLSFTTISRDWQNLSDALTLLQTGNAAVLREALQHLPSLGSRFTSSVIFLLSAIKGGNVRELLGARVTGRIATIAPELLGKLQQDVVQMQQFYVDSPLNQWAGLTVPMLFGQELHQARLYIRRDDSAAGHAEPGSKGQRFIIEVDMTQLGDIQFDGFVRSVSADKTFDLMIRTARALPADIQHGIRGVFQTAADVTGLKGQITFQQGSQHFVRPLASAARETPSGGDSQAILA